MGWTGISHDAPKTYREEKDFLTREFTFTTPYEEESTVVGMSKVGSVWYMAIRVTGVTGAQSNHYVEDTDYVFGMVIMTSRYHGEWQFKQITETSGPVDTKAPRKILKLLSELSDDDSTSTKWAAQWRARCEEHINAKKTSLNLKIGDVVKLKTPVSFNNVEIDEVRVSSYFRRGKTRRCYYNSQIGLLRLSSDHLVDATLVA
jgi:hypothetical protein